MNLAMEIIIDYDIATYILTFVIQIKNKSAYSIIRTAYLKQPQYHRSSHRH